MRFRLNVFFAGLVVVAGLLAFLLAMKPTGAPVVREISTQGGVVVGDETAAWQAVLAKVAERAPATLPLPALDFDAEGLLDAQDSGWVAELAAMLRATLPGQGGIILHRATLAGQSTPEDIALEDQRLAALGALLNPEGAVALPIATPAPEQAAAVGSALVASLTINPAAEVEDIAATPGAGPVESLRLGGSLALPEVGFRPGTAEILPGSAAMLADLGKRTTGLGAARFQVFVVPQTRAGISTEADAALELARIKAAVAALGAGWGGTIAFADSPEKPLPPGDGLTLAITLTALPDVLPPVWAKTPGAPDDAHALGFSAVSSPEDFALNLPQMLASDEGMVDFWTSPQWSRLNGYDPALFDIGSGEDTVLALHMLDNRMGLAVWTGIPDLFLAVPYDFSENRAYHIALTVTPTEMRLMVDGQLLEPAIALPLGKAPAARLRLGNDAARQSPYIGRIGALRLWHAVPDAADMARLNSIPNPPLPYDPLRADLSAAMWWNPATARVELAALRPLQIPDEGWYATLADGDIRMLNPDEFERGEAAPVFSEAQQDWQDQQITATARPTDPGNPGAFGDTGLAQGNPSFALRRAFRLKLDDGIDIARLQRPAPASFAVKAENPWEMGSPNWGLSIFTDAGGVVAVVQTQCQTSARVGDRWTCPDPVRPGQTRVIFDTDEILTGMGWTMTGKAMRGLYFSTNKRVIGGFGGAVPADETVTETYNILLPAGVQPTRFTRYFKAGHMVDFSLVIDPRHARPGVTLVSETGAVMRFVRAQANSYESADGTLGFLTAMPGASQVANPKLFMLPDGHLKIEGIPQFLRPLPEHPEGQPGAAFNDTFVSLSKAVNLQANYMGYDAVSMDPLHLTRTGTHHPVFRMPDGDSRDYYDANRIFVPTGLHYFAEFTGKQHASVTTADTYSEYFDSFKDTVSFGIGGKAAPGSFSPSATMTGARKSIAEAKNSRTRALSRAVFYDLVLDYQHMELDDLFTSEAALLRDSAAIEGFIDTFGTHYPVAVVYGGLGVLEVDATESMREQMRQNGISVKMEASVLLDAASKTSASFGFEQDSEHAETFRQVMGSQVENFYWIGGTHAGASNAGWTVGTDGVVPVHVQLRPLWELLSPLYFDDPAIYVSARLALKQAIEQRLATAARGLAEGVEDDNYIVELRVENVSCTSDPANSMREPAQKAEGPYSFKLTARQVEMFPMVGMALFDGKSGLMRNLLEPQLSETTDYKPLRVHCPSQANLMERSPYAADNALFRYQVQADDILSGGSSFIVLDRLDLESLVIDPPVDQKSAEVKTKAFLAGLTLGISVLVDELTNDDGSPLVRATKAVFRPQMAQAGFNLRATLCAAGSVCPASRADLDQMSGVWMRQSVQMPRTACDTLRGVSAALAGAFSAAVPLYYCQPRRVDYSLRVLK